MSTRDEITTDKISEQCFATSCARGTLKTKFVASSALQIANSACVLVVTQVKLFAWGQKCFNFLAPDYGKNKKSVILEPLSLTYATSLKIHFH